MSGAASYLAEVQKHEKACSLLVLWSLIVINMGNSGWHLGPRWQPSPRAQLSPRQARSKLAASRPHCLPAPSECRPRAGCQRFPRDAPARQPQLEAEGEEEAGEVSWGGMKAEPACACRGGSNAFFC